MAVLDRLRPTTSPTSPDGGKLPDDVLERLDRGREAMRKASGKRRMCHLFFKGEQYCWVNEKGAIQFQPTVTYVNGGKPPHRVRTTRNYIRGHVENKISTSTNATPAYDISPTSTDQEDASAATLAKKVAMAGYDKWGVRKARVKTVTRALVMDGGYAMPYFDANVGPFVQVGDEMVGRGEIKILTLNGSQVAWEPGTDFDDSPWHAVIRAWPISEVEAVPGFDGKKLKPDAKTGDGPNDDRATDKQVLVTEYFERPTPKRPRGRKLCIANSRRITPEEDYPVRDPDGNVLDEPVLHQLVYTLDPDSDRDMGLVEDLVEAQRTLNDCVSKEVEWKNRCLNPQILAPVGSLKQGHEPNDEPGRINWYNPVGGQPPPQWQQTPAIPRELFDMAEQATRQMEDISSEADVSAQPNVAAATVQSVLAAQQNRWNMFLSALAEFDSSVMRHCLYLAARYYTEPRLLEYRGHTGWENIADFKGGNLRGQCNVRVLASSLQSRTREQIRQDIAFFVQYFPGAISAEEAMAAWYGGLAENLIQSYELDVARANEVIRAIRGGPGVLFSMPPRVTSKVDPQTGQMQMVEEPWWMPGPSDNLRIWKQIIGSYLKTPEYSSLEPGMQAAGREVYNGIESLEQQRAMEQAQQQNMMASQLGAANAAAPQDKALPSLPAPQGGNGLPAVPGV